MINKIFKKPSEQSNKGGASAPSDVTIEINDNEKKEGEQTMEGKVEYNEEYFKQMMEESANETVDKKKAERVLSKLKKSKLAELFQLDGAEFYKKLLFHLGTLRYFNPNNNKLRGDIEDIKKATGLDGEELQAELDKLEKEHEEESKLSGKNTIKLICGKLLGFLKVCWDASIISVGLFSRVSVKLVANVAKALKDTGVYAIQEGKCAGNAIKDSWERNMNY